MSLNRTLQRAAARLRPVMLTHAERRRLIESPISFNIIGGRASAGTCVTDDTSLNRLFTPTPDGTGMWRIRGEHRYEP